MGVGVWAKPLPHTAANDAAVTTHTAAFFARMIKLPNKDRPLRCTQPLPRTSEAKQITERAGFAKSKRGKKVQSPRGAGPPHCRCSTTVAVRSGPRAVVANGREHGIR